MAAAAPRVAVVGHVEWVEFAAVPRIPAPGEIVHADAVWAQAAGGGAVAAVQLARMAGGCDLFTAFGADARGAAARRELGERGVNVYAADVPEPQRRALTFLDRAGERTIVVLGERLVPAGSDPLPWERLEDTDAAYFTGGEAAALRAARAARTLVATPRAADVLAESGIAVDVLVLSGGDAFERAGRDRIDPPPAFTVVTAGAAGGRWAAADGRSGTWEAAPPPGPAADAYGCGDTFAAGLTYALGAGRDIAAAVAWGAACGAACLTGRGPYGAALPTA